MRAFSFLCICNALAALTQATPSANAIIRFPHKVSSRKLVVSKKLSNGADLSVGIAAPAKVELNGSCEASANVKVQASVGKGVPDVTYIFVLDESGSTALTAQNNTRDAMAKFFTNLTDLVFDKGSAKNVGVVHFSNSAEIVSGLTNDKHAIKSAVNQLKPRGSTNCVSGLKKALKLAKDAKAGGTVITFFAGDGECNGSIHRADRLKKAADDLAAVATVEAIAIGKGLCAPTRLGAIPRSPGTCNIVSDSMEYDVRSVIGARLEKLTLLQRGPTPNRRLIPAPQKAPIEVSFIPGVKVIAPGTTHICAVATGSDELTRSTDRTVIRDCTRFEAVDVTAPTITCPPVVTIPTDPGTCSSSKASSLVLNATDNCDKNLTTTTATPEASRLLKLGSKTRMTSTVADKSGNAASCNYLLKVEDWEAPTCTCISEYGALTLGGSDNCKVKWIHLLDTGSGHKFGPFPDGTTVQYTIKSQDGATKEERSNGKISITGTGPAKVIVRDSSLNVCKADCKVLPPKKCSAKLKPCGAERTSCCKGLECHYFHKFRRSVCVPPPPKKCQPAGYKCGDADGTTNKTCCNTLTCDRVKSNKTFVNVCVKPKKCLALHKACGNITGAKCCSGMECRLSKKGIKKFCFKIEAAVETCSTKNELCGDTKACCSGFTCRFNYESGKKVCFRNKS